MINNINTIPYYKHHLQSVTCCSLPLLCRYIFLHVSSSVSQVSYGITCCFNIHLKGREVRAIPVSVPTDTTQKNVSTFQYSTSFLGIQRLHLNNVMKRGKMK